MTQWDGIERRIAGGILPGGRRKNIEAPIGVIANALHLSVSDLRCFIREGRIVAIRNDDVVSTSEPALGEFRDYMRERRR